MKHRPIHENLDTSFVNLSALVRYLRRRQFVGQVRIELSGYEADICLGEANALRAREYDRIAGRIAEGEEALQRILIRSREPGGIVNVYQQMSENEAKDAPVQKASAAPPQPQPVKPPPPPAGPAAPFTPKPAAPAVQTPQIQMPQTQISQVQAPPPAIEAPVRTIAAAPPKPKIGLPELPFEFTNRVEEKARLSALSDDDWRTLLDLTGELLETIDKTLAAANLDFPAAFHKARAEVALDYPFLDPATDVFEYKNGKVSMREKPSAKLFTASIVEILQRILEKLYSNPKFNILYRHTTQRIRAVAAQRKSLYDRFFITAPLEKALK